MINWFKCMFKSCNRIKSLPHEKLGSLPQKRKTKSLIIKRDVLPWFCRRKINWKWLKSSISFTSMTLCAAFVSLLTKIFSAKNIIHIPFSHSVRRKLEIEINSLYGEKVFWSDCYRGGIWYIFKRTKKKSTSTFLFSSFRWDREHWSKTFIDITDWVIVFLCVSVNYVCVKMSETQGNQYLPGGCVSSKIAKCILKPVVDFIQC